MKQPSLMDKQFGPERMYENTPRRLFTILILMLLTIVVFSNWIAVAIAADNVNLTLEGHFGGVTYAADVSGNYAYVGQGQDLVVLDISNASQPSELGKIHTGGIVYDISISGSYAYVADYSNGLVILRTDASVADTTVTPLKGDLNGDKHITPADAAIALRLAATGAHDDAADGSVTSLDALMILQAAAGGVTL